MYDMQSAILHALDSRKVEPKRVSIFIDNYCEFIGDFNFNGHHGPLRPVRCGRYVQSVMSVTGPLILSITPGPFYPIRPLRPVRPVRPLRPVRPVRPLRPVRPVCPLRPVRYVLSVRSVRYVLSVRSVRCVLSVRPVHPVRSQYIISIVDGIFILNSDC